MRTITKFVTTLAAAFLLVTAAGGTAGFSQENGRSVLFPAKKAVEEPAMPVKKLKKKKAGAKEIASKKQPASKQIAAKADKKVPAKTAAKKPAKKKGVELAAAKPVTPGRKSLFAVLFSSGTSGEEAALPLKNKPAATKFSARKPKLTETALALTPIAPLADPLESIKPLKKGKKAKAEKLPYDPKFEPQTVAYDGSYEPGTIIIDSQSKFLYLVEGWGMARRYGVAVGKEGLGWTGEAAIGDMQEWPRWIPTKEMVERDPKKYAKYDEIGMDGGPENPLGARAMYLYQGKKDTYIRIHGTNAPSSIGHAASNGCFRMVNEHVMDLYSRVGMGTKVVVL
jgi:lipoprotein-anchoring transpeptidase ErfK/SrfK